MNSKLRDKQLIEVYRSRFVNRRDVWFRQWIDNQGRCQYAAMKPGSNRYEPVSASLIAAHLNGSVTISWPAVNEDGYSKWCCWDSDHASGHIARISDVLQRWGFTTLRESIRTDRDGHLWLFFDRVLPAEHLIRLNREVLHFAEVPLKSVANPNGVEFFPASSTRHSQVRGPLGIHRKPEAANIRGWFQGAEQDVRAQIAWLGSQPLASSERWERMARALLEADFEKQRSFKPKPRTERVRIKKRLVPIIQLAREAGLELRSQGSEYRTQCPCCADSGQDTHKDNLSIKRDGTVFACLEGGLGAGHSGKEIYAKLLQQAGYH